MRTVTKRIISIMLCISMLAGLIVVGDASDDRTLADTSSNLNYANNEAICFDYPTDSMKTNPDSDLGTSSNPFVVVEVVPTLDSAQFGYLIPGCEPIDMEKAARDYANTQGDISQFTDAFRTQVDEKIYSFYEDIPDNTPYYVSVTSIPAEDKFKEIYSTRKFKNGYITETPTQYNYWHYDQNDEKCKSVYGYFEKVAAGTGDFVREKQDWYPFNADENEAGYYFVYKEGGDYIWHTSQDKTDSDSNHIWTHRTDRFVCEPLEYVNNDKLIKRVYDGHTSANFISKVVTITPELLKEHMNLIDDADMMVFHTADTTPSTMKLWTKYNKWGKTDIDSNGIATPFSSDIDLTNEMDIRIMQRMVSDNPTALVFQMKPWDNNKVETNLDKLMLMSMQFKPKDFVETYGFLEAVEQQTAEANSSTLVYNHQAKWNINTFTKDSTGKNIKDKMRCYKLVSAQHNVFEKIFTYNGNCSLIQDFLSDKEMSYDAGNDNREEMVKYYGSGKDKYSILDAMKYILSGPQFTPKLRVLEVQPCQQFIYKNDKYELKDQNGNKVDGGWKKYYEQLFPWYTAAEGENWVEDESLLQVTTMTTAEFVGSTGRYEYGRKDEHDNPVLLTTDSSDDLIAKYDLIVIGSMQDKSNGKDGYNDPNLGKLIYTAVGDLVYKYCNTQKNDGGVLSPAKLTNVCRDRMRYSGNDITLKKMLELEDFLKAGKPVVVDQNLYKNNQIDTDKVDKDSKLYDLLTWKDPDTERNAQNNILRYNSYDSVKMQELINNSKCQIRFIDDTDAYPLEYNYLVEDKANAKGVIKAENYQSKEVDEDGNEQAVMTYHFYIDGVQGTKYQLRLNLDSDGDGVYRGSLREHSEIDNMNEALGKSGDDKDTYDSLERPLKMSVYKVENGERVLQKAEAGKEVYLDANTEYYATYALSKDRLGLVPWKLEVNNVDNPYLRSSAINFTAFSKANDEDKVQLNVLQMCLSHGGRNAWTDFGFSGDCQSVFTTKSVKVGSYYEPEKKYTDRSNDDDWKLYNKLSGNQRATAEKFKTYLDPVQEFDVHIQYMFNSDWDKLFGDNAKDASGKVIDEATRIKNWEAFLSQYDMVVLGFMDENCITENKTYITGINDFISKGKSMILSHDTVEGANANSKYYGKYIPWLRTVAGQRRAFYNKQEKENGDSYYKKSYLTTKSNGKIIDKDYDEENKKNIKYEKDSNTIKKVYNGEIPGYIHPNLRADTSTYGHVFNVDADFNSVEDEFMGTFVKENLDNAAQLYINYASDSWRKDRVDEKFDRVELRNNGNRSMDNGWPASNAGTSVVKLTNNGQITTYPYHINSFITVSNTHCQNYQLDMDYEEGGDTNVWFNLTDFYDTELNDQKKTSDDVADEIKNKNRSKGNTAAYSAKNQDSRNNFYIYNKGNITYTGSGHGITKGGSRSVEIMTDDEVKLFVNTMISAYRPPEDSPYVSIDNANSVASNGASLLYVDYDSDVTGANLADGNVVERNGQKMVKVEFTVQDRAAHEGVTNQQYFMSIYKGEDKNLLSDDGTLDLVKKDDNSKVSSLENDKTIFKVEATTDDNPIKYIMYVPYSEVVNNGSVDYIFSTYSTYKKENNDSQTQTKSTKLSIMILPLFDLN